MRVLFPERPPPMVSLPEVGEDVLLLCNGEVKKAVERVRSTTKKAPGPDMIPNQVWERV